MDSVSGPIPGIPKNPDRERASDTATPQKDGKMKYITIEINQKRYKIKDQNPRRIRRIKRIRRRRRRRIRRRRRRRRRIRRRIRRRRIRRRRKRRRRRRRRKLMGNSRLTRAKTPVTKKLTCVGKHMEVVVKLNEKRKGEEEGGGGRRREEEEGNVGRRHRRRRETERGKLLPKTK